MDSIAKPDDILAAFETLDLKDCQTFLLHLPKILHLQEKEHLRRDLNSRIDPTVKLPIELVTEVLRYLEPRETVRCRRVSTSWHRLLTSDLMCGKLLRNWHREPYRRNRTANTLQEALLFEQSIRRPHLQFFMHLLAVSSCIAGRDFPITLPHPCVKT